MQTMTAREAKTHFGVLLDTMQREPVLVTKNNRPVGIMISIEDASDSLIPELHMEKLAGYDKWLKAKVEQVRSNLKSGASPLRDQDEVMTRAWQRLELKAQTLTESKSA
jgi:prevent-host-death family protein